MNLADGANGAILPNVEYHFSPAISPYGDGWKYMTYVIFSLKQFTRIVQSTTLFQ